MNKPPCPVCKTNRHVHAYGSGHLFFCQKCGGQFDDDPEEGGTYGANPAARLEREERRLERGGQRKT